MKKQTSKLSHDGRLEDGGMRFVVELSPQLAELFIAEMKEQGRKKSPLARFIIADLTDPSSVPHELAMVVPGTVVPVQPILLEGQREYAMFVDLKKRYHWVLEPYQYKSEKLLIADLSDWVIGPAEAKAKEQSRK